MTDFDLPIERAGRVVATLPLLARTSGQNTNSTSFHVIKLPALSGNVDRLRHLTVEYCIQPLAETGCQAIWWTSYVVLARRGTLTRESGVYTEWDDFGTVSAQPIGIVAPRASGIVIADMSKGVLNSMGVAPAALNGTVLRQVDLRETSNNNLEFFVILVASGMNNGAYQVHGQATLEFRTRDGQ